MDARGAKIVDGTVIRHMYDAIRGVAERHGLSPAQTVPVARHVLDILARNYGITGGTVFSVPDDVDAGSLGS